jgi:hypothetical protein
VDDWRTGINVFRDLVPDLVVRELDPGGLVPDGTVRDFLAWTLFLLGLALVIRVGVSVARRLWWWRQGLSLVEPSSAVAMWLRRVAGIGAVALPWLGLARLHQVSQDPSPWLVGAGVCGGIWLLTLAADHNRLAFDRRQRAIVHRRGWAGGSLTESIWPLQSVLICEDGQPWSEPEPGAPKRRLEAQAQLQQELLDVLGSPRRTERWLARLVVEVDGIPGRATAAGETTAEDLR